MVSDADTTLVTYFFTTRFVVCALMSRSSTSILRSVFASVTQGYELDVRSIYRRPLWFGKTCDCIEATCCFRQGMYSAQV